MSSFLQVNGNEFDFDAISKAVETIKTKNKGKSVSIYVKPEDRAIYYVVDGKEGKKVEFGDLGTFYLAAKTIGADTEDDFNMGQNIKGLFLRFSPNRQDINDLSSKTLKKRASFMNAKDLVISKTKKKTEENQEPSGD